MTDILTRTEIEVLVNHFYERVKADDLLAPVFAHVDWPHHLPVMYNFWSSVLLGDQSYNGSPMSKHLGLAITTDHFSRWLMLFVETVDTEFKGPIADEAKNRAQNIANLFQFKMGLLK